MRGFYVLTLLSGGEIAIIVVKTRLWSKILTFLQKIPIFLLTLADFADKIYSRVVDQVTDPE
jgi:hypothetical protein